MEKQRQEKLLTTNQEHFTKENFFVNNGCKLGIIGEMGPFEGGCG